jgi:uncharacterized protein (TIGR00369 family)
MDALDRWSKGQVAPPPVVDLLGISLLEYDTGTSKLELRASSRHHNAMGTVHGGILCDLADVAMGVALATVLEDRETFTTLGIQASYFRQIREGRLTAIGKTVRRGRTTAHCECEILDEQEALVAKAASTCLIVVAPDAAPST